MILETETFGLASAQLKDYAIGTENNRTSEKSCKNKRIEFAKIGQKRNSIFGFW